MNVNPIRRCSECPNMTRPSRTLLAEYPGTTQRNGGMCIACYKEAAKLAIKRTGADSTPRQSIEEIQAGLDAYIRRRHEREAMMMRRENYEMRIA